MMEQKWAITPLQALTQLHKCRDVCDNEVRWVGNVFKVHVHDSLRPELNFVILKVPLDSNFIVFGCGYQPDDANSLSQSEFGNHPLSACSTSKPIHLRARCKVPTCAPRSESVLLSYFVSHFPCNF